MEGDLNGARGTGTLEVEVVGQKRRLFFRDGGLFLAGSHPLARRLGELVEKLARSPAGGAAAPRSAADVEARNQCADLVQRMASVISEWRQGRYRFDGDAAGLPPELVGPLPTQRLVMIGSTLGVEEAVLLTRLGGLRAQLVAGEPDSEPDALGLEPEEVFLLERLGQAMELEKLLAESPVSRHETLERLVQLKIAGRVRSIGREESGAKAVPSLDSVLVERLSQRFDRDLREEPLVMSVEEFRRRITDLFGRLGGMNAYELLDVEPAATSELVQARYEELARVVHPANEAAFGLSGLEPMLAMLFERATQAYLTLSDPERRRRYNEAQAIDVGASAVTGAQREEEQRTLARQHYEHALALAARGDFHFAVELLELAAKTDRKAEYLLALSRIQAKNPKWANRAIESCRAALELDPHNADVRYQLGELYEAAGDLNRARAQYTAAARENPNHAQAAAKMRGLAGTKPERKPTGGLFERLFGRRE